jgi:hypothetical protein
MIPLLFGTGEEEEAARYVHNETARVEVYLTLACWLISPQHSSQIVRGRRRCK